MTVAFSTYSMILGSLMTRRSESKRLSQQEFFTKSGIATGTWSRIMRGQAHFQIEDIRGASRALGCSVSDLTVEADRLETRLKEEEDVVVASKKDLKAEGSNLIPGIIAAAALAFLVYRLMK